MGTNVLAWIKIAAIIAALALITYLVFKLREWFPKIGATVFGAAKATAAAPYQATNKVVTTLTGREETLGGWLAELFNPATRAVAESFARNNVPRQNIKPTVHSRSEQFIL